MKIPFFGPSYESTAQMETQTCVNLYLEKNEGGQGEEASYIGTPGTRLMIGASDTIGSGGMRGILVDGDYIYMVCDNAVSRSSSITATGTIIGYISSGEGPVSMTSNGLQIAIAHSAGISVYTISTGVFADVLDAPVDSVLGYIDSYILAISTNGTFFWTDIGEATVIDGLSFASAEGSPDDLVSLIVDHREVWLFGTDSTEIWGSSGDAEQPFIRTGNAFIEHGCAAKFSPAKINNTVVWLGRDGNGQGIVLQADGYTPIRISTHGIEYQLSTYSTISDAIGMTYQLGGHAFYVLTFPTADKTWQFDFSTGVWSELRYTVPNTGEHKRHHMNNIAFWQGRHVIGANYAGFLLWLNPDEYTDEASFGASWSDGGARAAIYRERGFIVPPSGNKWQRHISAQLMCEVGVGLPYAYVDDGVYGLNGASPVVWLERSRDYGRTWVNCGNRGIGGAGAYQTRVIWRRLGTHRHASYRVCMTDPVKCVWYGVEANG